MFILHGDNQILSRQMYLSLRQENKKNGFQIIDFAGDNLTFTELQTALNSTSLFGLQNFVFIENFFSRRPSKDKTEITKYLVASLPANLVVWEGKDTSIQLKNIPLSVIKKFDLPKYIFQFLENWTLSGLKQAISTSSPEQVFSLLVRHLRQLIMVKDGSVAFPAWQIAKLKTQTQHYSLSRLLELYTYLLNIDYSQKTSTSPLDLSAALELWVVKALR